MERALDGWLSRSCALLVVAAALASSAAPAHAEAGAAVAWGENWHGQLGAFFRSSHEDSPIPVEGLTNIDSVAAADSFNLALLSDGTVASWGGNIYGQLGNNGYKANWELGRSHVQVGGLTGVKAIAAANEHALALMSDGTVRAWGNNQYGQLGNGRGGFEAATGQNQRVPKTVVGLTHVAAIASGGPSNYAVLENGTVMAWGGNPRGQLGTAWPENCQKPNVPGCGRYECKTETGNELCSPTPALVMIAANKPLSEVVAVSAGAEAAYALLKDGEVVSWGGNLKGELGQLGALTGPHGKFRPPGRVTRSNAQALANVAEVSSGYDHVLARLNNGEVVGWGNSADGELGETGPAQTEICQILHPERGCVKTAQPLALPAGQVEAIAGGAHYSVALIRHQVYTWGGNDRGQLGNGGTSGSRVPTAVAGLGQATSVSAAGSHVVALLGSGVQPPAPPVTIQPAAGALDLAWTSDNAERIVDRVFERPSANEAEEGEEPPGAEAAASGEAGGSPQSTTRPRVKGEAREGQQLSATDGTWGGVEPVRYEYQWQRCRAGQCVQIAGATGAIYTPGSADPGFTLQCIVTAVGAGETRSAITSRPTQTVKTEEEGRRSKPNSVWLHGSSHSTVIAEIHEAPLEAVPYEIKFTIGGKVRMMVATPLAKALVKAPSKAAAEPAVAPSAIVAPTTPAPPSCPQAGAVCAAEGPGSGPAPAPSSPPAAQSPLGQESAPLTPAQTPQAAGARPAHTRAPHPR